MKTEKITKNIIKILAFVCITAIPFLSITQVLGLEAFLDSFENPDKYMFLKNEGKYEIIQKSTHSLFSITESDTVLYYGDSGDVSYEKINNIVEIGAIKRYYSLDEDNSSITQSIYESQILGKVIKETDDSLWNTITMKIWEISINNLNIRALIAD